MSYRNIKNILKTHIKKNVKSLWTWDVKNNHFKFIYKQYNDKLPIYTPKQLLEKIKEQELIK